MSLSRRNFLGTALTAGASGLFAKGNSLRAQTAAPDVLNLENDSLLVAIDRATGCVVSLETKDGAWKMQGAGMRLHVPAPDHRFHFLTEAHTGKPQIDADSEQATITWRGFESARMGKLDIEVKETVKVAGGGVRCNYEIRNRSGAVIESYTYPRLKGIKPPSGDDRMRQSGWGYSGMNSMSLWPTFGNSVGYWGYDTPAQLRDLGTECQFCLMLSDTHGVYLGYHDEKQRQVVQVCYALAPAYADSYDDAVEDETGKVADATVGIDFNHLCFIQPGASQQSEALLIEPFQGDWHAGADIYKAWRAQWHKKPEMPAWVEDVHSWQEIQINSSEDRLEFPYKDLTKYAESCKRWGVKAIQLTGWQLGGQDRDFPLHDIDPRLGTAEDLKAAIAASKAMGVEIVLFNKYQWADVTGPKYETDFKQFAIEDPYGNPIYVRGYNYDTPTQLEGLNTRHAVGECTASPSWWKRALVEFRKSVELGASGILIDECSGHPSQYCFSRDHGHGYPAPVFAGDVPFLEEFRSIVNGNDFVFAGESVYDVQQQVYNLSYFRIHNGHTPFARYIDPFKPMLVAVTGWDDREMINACLLFRYAISYEPRNFHGELDEMPVSMQYGRSVDDLRRRYRDWLWDAEFRDTMGAKVLADGAPLKTYSVFRRADGRRAIVMANIDSRKPIACEVMFDDGKPAAGKWVSPENPEPQPWPGKLEVAPAGAIVFLEG
jgi:Domain of unknown function (DUF6259)